MTEPWLDIWSLDLTLEPTPDTLKRWSDCLSRDELSRSKQFRDKHRRTQAIAARSMLRHALSFRAGRNPAAWNIRQMNNERPHLKPSIDMLDFNVSHTDGLVLCAVSSGFPVGVDVEHKNRAADVTSVSESIFSEQEKIHFLSLDADTAETFALKLWTFKEALSKATGQGLELDFTSVSLEIMPSGDTQLSADAGWHFQNTTLPTGHVASVAWHTAARVKPRFRDGGLLLNRP